MSAALDGTVVAVVGLGPMGRGIARVFDAAGARVHVVDVSPEVTAAQLDQARAEAEADGQRRSRARRRPTSRRRCGKPTS